MPASAVAALWLWEEAWPRVACFRLRPRARWPRREVSRFIGDSQGPLGVTFTPSFEIDRTLTFQPLGHRLAFFNGDLALKPEETNPFIDALLVNGLIFQAFHQHYIEMKPQIWFIHWRGIGDPIKLAEAVHNVLKATSTPLPQTNAVQSEDAAGRHGSGEDPARSGVRG